MLLISAHGIFEKIIEIYECGELLFFDDDELLMILIDEILRFVNIKIACNNIIYLSTIYWFVTIEKLFQWFLLIYLYKL